MKTIIKFFSPLCLIISILIFVYTFYQSEVYWKGVNRNFYLNYYILSIILIIFSLITFKINEKIKKYLSSILVSFIFTLYLFEGYITFVKGGITNLDKKIKIYEKNSGKKYDTRTKFQIYRDKIKKKEKIVVHVSAESYKENPNEKLHPLSGISNSNTILCNENGYYAIRKSDKYGFNNPNSEWDKNKEIEYLLVGDSFTHGACVNRPDDIGSVLRVLSKKSVLNLGYGGNGPLLEYATLREYLSPNVKNVLWLYYEGNDLFDLKKELNIQLLKNYLKDKNFTQNLKQKQNEIDSLAKSMIENQEKRFLNREAENLPGIIPEKKNNLAFKTKKFIKLFFTRNLVFKAKKYKTPPLPEFQMDEKNLLMPEFKKILKLSKELANKNNSNFYFVYLPDYSSFKNTFQSNYNESLQKKNREIKLILKELNISLIDIKKEVFEKEDNPKKFKPFGLDGHYTVEGYKKVAETIYKLLL